MTALAFRNIMIDFYEQYFQNEKFYSEVEKLFGCGATEEIITHNYMGLIIAAIKEGLSLPAENSDLEFFIFDCEWDYEEFCRRTTVKNKHPQITNFVEFYRYLIGEEISWYD
jgi:hypothetical protein